MTHVMSYQICFPIDLFNFAFYLIVLTVDFFSKLIYLTNLIYFLVLIVFNYLILIFIAILHNFKYLFKRVQEYFKIFFTHFSQLIYFLVDFDYEKLCFEFINFGLPDYLFLIECLNSNNADCYQFSCLYLTIMKVILWILTNSFNLIHTYLP